MGGQKAKVKDNEEVRSQEPEVRSRRSGRYRPTDQTRMAQPIRNARPPIGVMAPSQRISVALKR